MKRFLPRLLLLLAVLAILAAMIAAKSRVECFVTDCKWLDIGRPEDYGVAQAIVSDGYDAFVKPSP